MSPDPHSSPDITPFMEIFASDHGIRAVDSPVKVRILTLLREKEMPFEELVSTSGKAKSTVSVHLSRLAEEGIIGSRPDPRDARKKIFYLNSSFLGGVSATDRQQYDPQQTIPSHISADLGQAAFFRFLFTTIRVTLLNEGIVIDPIYRRAGIHAGNALYQSLADSETGTFISNIAKFWENHRLGRVLEEGRDPVTLSIYDCFECVDMPQIGRPACPFDSGVFEALFSGHFGNECRALETRCYAMGDDHCRFELKVPEAC